ncbi:2'-5' RNA ligase family protein [Crassaminicella profunda]|uniref:2'-5' RNA ligase family protein n=1 Tax=Crassaminicella profunda TaxID=1286698 RepID=UPI001CA67772|nr:2'-5' RNA ligase family protein [Crassaminicella profunda]QZY57243.1 2'-5' RNA ligase family protein [Crassaminicella profunda]
MENMIFLVTIPKGPLYHCCRKIQESLWKEYNLGIDRLPEIHLTIDAFYYEDLNELEKIKNELHKVIAKISPFEIRSSGFGYIPHPHNCITLHIVKTKELKNVYTFIHNEMKEKGFRLRDFSPEEIVFHITLAGIHGRAWSEEESLEAFRKMRDFKLTEMAFVDELELWHPELDPEKKLISRVMLGAKE